jgi:hypothetical protein
MISTKGTYYRIVSIDQCLDKIKHNTWYKKYTVDQLMSFDHPELKDITLRNKIEK